MAQATLVSLYDFYPVEISRIDVRYLQVIRIYQVVRQHLKDLIEISLEICLMFNVIDMEINHLSILVGDIVHTTHDVS